MSTFQYYNQQWIAHLVPIEIVPFEKMSFLDARIYVKNNRYIPTSDFNIDYMMKRSMSVYGMSKSAYMYNNLTLGMEYVWNCLVRIYKLYEEVGRFACKITSRGDFYPAMINTSMICWMDFETGHIEFTNMRLIYNQTDVIFIPYCRIELDHEVSL